MVIQLDSPLDFWALPYVNILSENGTGTTGGYRGQLLDPLNAGAPTGVDLEIRTSAALPTTGQTPNRILADPGVLFATSTISSVLPIPTLHPVVVAAPWAHSDLALQWNAANLSMRTIADIARLSREPIPNRFNFAINIMGTFNLI